MPSRSERGIPWHAPGMAEARSVFIDQSQVSFLPATQEHIRRRWKCIGTARATQTCWRHRPAPSRRQGKLGSSSRCDKDPEADQAIHAICMPAVRADRRRPARRNPAAIARRLHGRHSRERVTCDTNCHLVLRNGIRYALPGIGRLLPPGFPPDHLHGNASSRARPVSRIAMNGYFALL